MESQVVKKKRSTEKEDSLAWTYEQNVKFIRKLKKFDVLWNRTDRNYGSTLPRKKAMRELGERFDISSKMCEKKVQYFNKKLCHMRNRAKGMTPAEVKARNWRYHEELQFMEQSFQEKKKNAAKHQSRAHQSTQSASNEKSSAEKRAKPNGTADDDDDIYMRCEPVPKPISTPSQNIKVEIKTEPGRIVATNPIEPTVHQPDRSNVVDAFFTAMATTVKTFPATHIAKVKLQVGQMIAQMEVDLMGEPERDIFLVQTLTSTE